MAFLVLAPGGQLPAGIHGSPCFYAALPHEVLAGFSGCAGQDQLHAAVCLSLWQPPRRVGCSAVHMKHFAGILVLAGCLPGFVLSFCLVCFLCFLAVEPKN